MSAPNRIMGAALTVCLLAMALVGASCGQTAPEPKTEGETKLVARATGDHLEVYVDGKFRRHRTAGVNLGFALPGRWFTEFPRSKQLYLRWLGDIAAMGADTIRIYTLIDPEFYTALREHNLSHPGSELWLLQEIWPEEDPAHKDYLGTAYMSEYEAEIERDIDAVHGNADIPSRKGRASGRYRADVSPWILGFLIGRELEPEEVEATNRRHPGYRWSGDYVKSTPGASAAEAWLARACDKAVSYEQGTYGWQHPVAIVSWPTLDKATHPTEQATAKADALAAGEKRAALPYNDRVTVDINKLEPGTRLKAGIFGAYHIYPNYPDFMNTQSSYATYKDEQGVFRYGGYLREFIRGHRKYPAIVAEFGLATGSSTAHLSPGGYNHGGLSEDAQARGVARMFKAIENEGYAGAIIFEWADEWAKKTWITAPQMVPYDRHALWRNSLDPEQNYGLVAMESLKPEKVLRSVDGSGEIMSINYRADEAYFYIDTAFTHAVKRGSLVIGIDTFRSDRGLLSLPMPQLPDSPVGLEAAVVVPLDQQKAYPSLLVPESYNMYNYRFSSPKAGDRDDNMAWSRLAPLLNRQWVDEQGKSHPAQTADASHLRLCKNGSLDPGDLVCLSNSKVSIRIPWALLGFSDPSSMLVIDDSRVWTRAPGVDELNTSVSNGVNASGYLLDGQDKLIGRAMMSTGTRVAWETWNAPLWIERKKQVYGKMRVLLNHK